MAVTSEVDVMTSPATDALRVQILSEGGRPPRRAEDGAAGFDLFASASVSIPRGTRRIVSTGIAIDPPSGTYARIAPRSSLAIAGIDVAAGVVDPSYRGELKVLLVNNGETPKTFSVTAGDRVAQLVFERVCTPDSVMVCDELSDTQRGDNGFGSTGK